MTTQLTATRFRQPVRNGHQRTEVPLKHVFDCATRQIKAADSLPALLATAFMGLELISDATAVLAQTSPKRTYQSAITEAADARGALTGSPTLAWPERSIPDTDVQELASAVAALVLVVSEAILTVASKTTDPADRIACLRAVHHAGNVHAAMR